MKAIVQDRYGSPDVLDLQEIDKPNIKDNEVLVRVRAAGVNPLDFFTVSGGMGRLFFGVRKPRIRIRGVDVAGTVEAVGRAVRQFRPGDAVFGGSTGAFAEYATAKESELAPKPGGITFERPPRRQRRVSPRSRRCGMSVACSPERRC